MAAVQLLPHVWMVGSGTEHACLTDVHDCHTYLVWNGQAGFLIDAGTGMASDTWLANVGDVVDPRRLAGVFVTHYHADHAGGAAAAIAAGLPVVSGPTTASALATADEDITQVGRAREAGIYPETYRLPQAAITSITAGPIWDDTGMQVQVIDAPGHCHGHQVLVVSTSEGVSLFSGDCVFEGGRISMQAIPDMNLMAYADTMTLLARLEVDHLFPGHGPVVLRGAGPMIERAAAAFAGLVPPPNFLQPW